MLQSKSKVQLYHERTNHSYQSVKINPNYVDSSTQPSAYKTYPHFYRRYPLKEDNDIHQLIKLTSAITLEKQYRHYTSQLRANPSAGGLYPTELYVQIRGLEGMISGLYHLEVKTNILTLIYELIDDGLEAYICPGKTVKGLIFLISCVYFRSSWKYQNRSLRYCLLDSGHHLGAIEAAAYGLGRQVEFVFDIDKIGLNKALGFENQEFVTGSAILGDYEDRPRRELRLKIPFVCGTDYFEPNSFIEQGYRDTIEPECDRKPLSYPQWRYNRPKFLETISQRRSARCFRKDSISHRDFKDILAEVTQAIATKSKEAIEIYSIVLRVEGIEPGIYRGLELIQAGDFSEKSAYLCVDQRIAGDSAVTLFMAAHAQNYQTATQFAGLLGQRVYLASQYRGIDCTGIGAYYDVETQDFLGTDKAILYALAIGR
ncbi:MAG: nitroreductase family protein [Cyanobacteria bacterium P01_D01_bin.44]